MVRSGQAYEEELLLVCAQDAVYEAIERSGLSRRELGKLLGVSGPSITQALRGDKPSLARLARIAHAAGHRLKISIEPLSAATEDTETRNRRGDPATELCARLQSETATGSHQRPDGGAEMERASPLRTSSPQQHRQTSGSSSR